MSPMPIREAVRRLDAVGLVENVTHRGGRGTQPSIPDLSEVYEAPLALEPLAMRRTAARFTLTVAEHARTCLNELESMADDTTAGTSEAHANFHFAFYEAAESAWLLRLIRPAWQVSERYALEWPEVRRLGERADE